MGMKLSSFSNRGSSLESLIDVSQRGVVCLTKMTAGVKWIGKGNPLPVAGPVDFVGEVCATGRSICFDAKQSAEAAGFPLSKLKPHQLDYLRRHGRSGAVAGVLVGATHHEVEAYLWLDWEDIPSCGGTVKWESDAWVECGRWGGMVDWGRIVGSKKEKR